MSLDPVEYSNAAEMLRNYRRIYREMRPPPPRKKKPPPPSLPPWTKPSVELVASDARYLHPIYRLMREVADRHDLRLDHIVGPGRTKGETAARFEFWYLAAVQTKHSIAEIARRSHHDHTSVMNGIRSYCARNSLPLPRNMLPRGMARHTVP